VKKEIRFEFGDKVQTPKISHAIVVFSLQDGDYGIIQRAHDHTIIVSKDEVSKGWAK